MSELTASLTLSGSATAIAAALAAISAASGQPIPIGVSVTKPVTPPMPQSAGIDDDDDADAGTPDVTPGALDASGIPWIESIHAATKTKTVKGMWKRQKGVSQEQHDAVAAQYRQQPVAAPMMQPQPAPMQPPMQQFQPQPAPVAAPMMQPQPMPPVQQFQPQPAPVAEPIPQAQPVATVQPATVADSAQNNQPALDFPTFMTHLSVQMQKPGPDGLALINTDYLAAVVQRVAQAFGQTLNSLTDIQTRPDMINYAASLIHQDGRWL